MSSEISDAAPTSGAGDADDRRAVGLYAVLARDAGDFIEDLAAESDRTLDTLYQILSLPNPKHDAYTTELNELGADIVAGVMASRGIPLPQSSRLDQPE